MRKELECKVRNSILLLRKAYRHVKHQGKRLEICISGGKDSDVLIELCKMGGIDCKKYLEDYFGISLDF